MENRIMLKNIIFLLIFQILFFNNLGVEHPKEEVITQTKILLNALNHNNALKGKLKKECVIAVLYNPQSTFSEEEKNLVVRGLNENKKTKVHDKKVKVVEIPVNLGTNLEKKIIIKGINVFWLTPNLDNHINKIREAAKYNQVTTISNGDNLVNLAYTTMGTQKTNTGHTVIINMTEVKNIKLNLHEKLFSDVLVIE